MRVGFIGCGNMGFALMSSIVNKKLCTPEDLIGSDKVPAALERISRELGVKGTPNPAEVVNFADFIFLSVKPQDVQKTMAMFKPAWNKRTKVLISICAGVTLNTLSTYLGKSAKIVRVMPNTPCLIGQMAAGYAPKPNVSEEEAATVGRILSASGVAYRLPESSIDAVTGLSGSGPAYVAHLIGEFAKAGEAVGLPKDVSYGLTMQTFKGTSQMLQEKQKSGMTTESLKKMVTSPHGTTYAGRQVMEKSNLYDIVEGTVRAGTVRSQELGEEQARALLKAKL